MKLGYTDFINKHKTKFIIGFVTAVLLVFLFPKQLYLEHTSPLIMKDCFFAIGIYIILFPLNLKSAYQNNEFIRDIYPSFDEYFKSVANYYIVYVFGFLIFLFAIVSLIAILIQHFKYKKLSKPLLYLPLALYLLYVIIEISTNGIYSLPFIGFYLAIILEILIILYCANYQRPHKPKPQQAKSRKPSDKERIAELERQVAELREEHSDNSNK